MTKCGYCGELVNKKPRIWRMFRRMNVHESEVYECQQGMGCLDCGRFFESPGMYAHLSDKWHGQE